MFTRSELLMFRKVQKERDVLEARLADMTAEADSWRANARDSGEEARKYKARLAEAKGLLEEIGDEWPAVKRTTVERAYAFIERATDSAAACGVCKGTGFHPGPYMCVICGGTGSTASAEHRHIYKHNADDTYGICECGKAFKVCPSCGMEIDATGETVSAGQEGGK